jgi:uncharacterized phosphosugar-binding protein
MAYMPKIVLSDDAPKGDLRFSLANAEIEKLPYETDDAVVVANAEAHPWLAVEYPEAKELSDQSDPFPQTKPEDDVLAAENSIANDPAAVRAEIDRRVEGVSDPVAIDAGLDQGDVIVTASGVSETVAADNATDRKVANAQKRAIDERENE